jgi:hypothetical protein
VYKVQLVEQELLVSLVLQDQLEDKVLKDLKVLKVFRVLRVQLVELELLVSQVLLDQQDYKVYKVY